MLCTADTEFVADWQPRTLKPAISFPKIDPGYSIILEPMICLWKIKVHIFLKMYYIML